MCIRDRYSDLAVEQMKLHKIPASITLAQGLLESGAGSVSYTHLDVYKRHIYNCKAFRLTDKFSFN